MPGIDEMVATAAREIGYREIGTNYTKFNRWLGKIPGYPHDGYGYAWCHSFLSWCLDKSGNAGAGPRTAGCEVGVAWFKARGRYHSSPKRGDFVYYGPGGGTHVELVVAVSSTNITTIGGNTSGSLDGRYFNGDGVYRKTVSRASSRIHGYGRPLYSTSQMGDDMIGLKRGDKGEQVKGLQATLCYAGYLTSEQVDGDYGPKTAAALLKMRQDQGSSADSGDKVTGWAYGQLLCALIKRKAPSEPGPAGPPGPQGPPGELPDNIAVTGSLQVTNE